MVILPSEDIRDIARRHKHEFPRSMRLLLRAMGGMHKTGSQLLSYLLFEARLLPGADRTGPQGRDARRRTNSCRSSPGSQMSAA